MTNTQSSQHSDPLRDELQRLADDYQITLYQVIMAASQELQQSEIPADRHLIALVYFARDIVKRHVGYISDSVIDDLTEDYASEMFEADEDDSDEITVTRFKLIPHDTQQPETIESPSELQARLIDLNVQEIGYTIDPIS